MPSLADDWPFDDPPNVAVVTTRDVTEDKVPILFVSHDRDDGAWQFLTGRAGAGGKCASSRAAADLAS